MSKVHWVKLDSTLNSSDFDGFVLPLVDRYEGKSLGSISRWNNCSDKSQDKSSYPTYSLPSYPTYTFPDQDKKVAFLNSIREIPEISTVEY